ncbi:MAG: hypothetical protein A3K77_07555 [Euryarchaeota archaeon RBG_13_31_8]|nr:MAG: hypothetical protein A3K77_07555 [Euryarchaeota archaeon RBG_13_31_8]
MSRITTFRRTENNDDAWALRFQHIQDNYKGIRFSKLFETVKYEKGVLDIYPPAGKDGRGCQSWMFNVDELKNLSYYELLAILDYIGSEQPFSLLNLATDEDSTIHIRRWIEIIQDELNDRDIAKKKEENKLQQAIDKQDYAYIKHQLFETMIKSMLRNKYHLAVESIDSKDYSDGELDLEVKELDMQLEIITSENHSCGVNFWKFNRAAELKRRAIDVYFLFRNNITEEEMFADYTSLIELVGLRSVGNKKIHSTKSIQKLTNKPEKGYVLISKKHLLPICAFYKLIEQRTR